jgi:hydrogenase/urease accessory protein HupE
MRATFRRLAILLGLGLGVCAGAQAHEVRPGYLELKQTGAESWKVLWKVPARGEFQLAIAPAWPENCALEGPPRRFATGAAATERSTIRCDGGLTGREIVVSGLSTTVIDVLARLQRSDGTAQIVRLTPSAPAFVVEEAPRWTAVATTYLGLGVEHILYGIDHLLFVLAMLLLVRSWRRLVATITAFTIAHSITLAAATLGFVHVPPQPVEAAIALSIVFVAAEIVHARMGRTGLTERWPWVVAFAFGLLHGLGFASALREVGLPDSAIPTALLFFNLGVELGQLAFVGVVLAVLASLRSLQLSAPAWSWRLASYGIGAVAMYWTIERVAAFAA